MPAKDLAKYSFYVIKGDDLSEPIGPFEDSFGRTIDTSLGTLTAVFESDSQVNRFTVSNAEIKRMEDKSIVLEKPRTDPGYSALEVGAKVYAQLKYLDETTKLRTLVELEMTVKLSRE